MKDTYSISEESLMGAYHLLLLHDWYKDIKIYKDNVQHLLMNDTYEYSTA
jgi:uncharacterized protein YdaU (DUF1376 family)